MEVDRLGSSSSRVASGSRSCARKEFQVGGRVSLWEQGSADGWRAPSRREAGRRGACPALRGCRREPGGKATGPFSGVLIQSLQYVEVVRAKITEKVTFEQRLKEVRE